MIKLKDCSTLQLMPEIFRKDPGLQAASYALKKTAQMLLKKIERSSVYARIELMPEEILDLLAEEFRAQYYDTTMPIERKREAVKKALQWYVKAGTVSAVAELTDLVWQSDSAQVQEWFEYESNPYLFRILLGTDMNIEEERIEEFLAAVWKVKNTRSHLESLTFKRELKQTVHFGAASRISTGHVIIDDVWSGKYELQKPLYFATGAAYKPQRITIKEE